MKYYQWAIIAAWVAIIGICALFWRPIIFVFSLVFLFVVM